jgi:Flp pilus assembly protein TadD
LKQTPNDINIKSNLGLSLALGKKIKESINILLPLSQEASPSPNVLHNLAIAYALSGHVSKAREIFSKELNSQEVEANLATLRTIP